MALPPPPALGEDIIYSLCLAKDSPTMKSPTSEQLTSLLLAVIALIPNHGVRYTALGLLLTASILYTIHNQSLSMQWHQLRRLIDQTEGNIQEGVVEAPRSYSQLTDQMRRLIE
ncbi:hypothetical protein B0H14DRAFT_3447897 [Mycena olivaceomarginata]|nr:hypothetical protein B0H14DRAFT_3447897 [Mycena olivaceomarginata]